MTETMIIIIVAGVVVIAFGVLCLVSMFKAQKETQNFVKKMVSVEKDLGQITKLVSRSVENSQKADQSILLQLQRQTDRQVEIEARAKAEKMFAEQKAAEQARAEAEAKAKAEAEAKAKAAEQANATKPVQPKETIPDDILQPEIKLEMDSDFNIDEIDINDLLEDLEDVLPDIDNKIDRHIPDVIEEPIQEPIKENTVPQLQHVDYDIGQSGKKYTASELEALIRE